MFNETINFIRSLYPNKAVVGLHEPIFSENERKYVLDAINSTFVSSVGSYVAQFEKNFSVYTKAPYSIVTSNGTSAIHTALWLLGIQPNDEVITQALTFVATANAIKHCFAHPIFVDSDSKNLGMSLESLQIFLETHCVVEGNVCRNKTTKRIIKACVPMHVFGHPVRIDEIVALCDHYKIPVIEDAAESLGSLYKSQHTGLYGKIGIFSFNGNKIVTSGGGGMIITSDKELGLRAKHITTTAKVPHKWHFYHDEVGFNYRMPNLNAALACAQLERVEEFVLNKRETAKSYSEYFDKKGIRFLTEPENARSNYWLNAIFLDNIQQRDQFLEEANANNVICRPVWKLMNELPAFKDCQTTDLSQARFIAERLVNIPSSVRTI